MVVSTERGTAMQIQRPIIDVTNLKTGKGGFLVSQYVRRDGMKMVEVFLGLRTAHWRADSCKLVAA